ncbi:MAG: PAS domain S-box protein, partial [Verrucomicrobia bacterium]|nr:PAS domain S-box protein [Verrucomicrobiota bacterium]
MKEKLHILHLEDSSEDAELIYELLASEWPGSEVTRVKNRDEFLGALEQGAYDVILSDYAMPSYDGLKALKLAREKCPQLPFVFCSGTLGEDRAVESLKAGATDYVLKQRLGRLVPCMERALQEAEQTAKLKSAEEHLREQAALLDKAQDAILVRGLDGRITYWNKSAERIYGWSAAEAAGRQTVELFRNAATPEHQEAELAVSEKGEWLGELRKATKDGREVTVQSRWTLVRDHQNQPKSILIIDTNITEKKKLEAQFLRAQRMESIGTLASGIAHDLNNILAPILMTVEILRLKPTEEKYERVLGIIEANVERGTGIIKQLLTFARGVEGARVAIQLRFLLKEITKLTRETFPKNITTTFQVCSDAWTVL